MTAFELINFSIAVAAFVVTSVALWVACLAFWTTSTTWLRIIDVDGGIKSSRQENHEEDFDYFSVTLQNRGLTLHDVKVSFGFEDDERRKRYGMQLVDFSDENTLVSHGDEFKTGMIGKYILRSYVYSRLAGDLHLFEDAKRNRARITISAQGYTVGEFRLWQRTHRFRSLWNRWAFKINSWTAKKRVKPDGSEWTERGKFPEFKNQSQFRIEDFARRMQIRAFSANAAKASLPVTEPSAAPV